jgi:putative N-acetyltransferase (TIGR04045 family)
VAELLHRAGVVCRLVDDQWADAEHHRIREEVFVHEQRLFRDADRDARDDDPETIKVLGLRDGVAGGAVRLYPLDRRGLWQGDRLAVLAGARGHGLGGPLVRFAVATAASRGGRRMLAHIQPRNVVFFRRLGWQECGDEEIYVGVPHVPMSIGLLSERASAGS